MKNVKVHFELEILEQGFPPISVETLNGLLNDDMTIQLDNTPFFVESVASGDILRCTKTTVEGIFEFQSVIKASGNKAISIIFIEDNYKGELCNYLDENDCYYEFGEFYYFNMLAISVPQTSHYDEISRYLDSMEKRGGISYSELCI